MSDKTEKSYEALLVWLGVAPEVFRTIDDSLKSDIQYSLYWQLKNMLCTFLIK